MAKIRRSPIGGFILSYENPHGQIQRSNVKMQSFQQICMHRLKKFAGIGQDTGHSGGYVSHSHYTSAGVYGSIGNRSAVGRNDAAAGVFRIFEYIPRETEDNDRGQNRTATRFMQKSYRETER